MVCWQVVGNVCATALIKRSEGRPKAKVPMEGIPGSERRSRGSLKSCISQSSRLDCKEPGITEYQSRDFRLPSRTWFPSRVKPDLSNRARNSILESIPLQHT